MLLLFSETVIKSVVLEKPPRVVSSLEIEARLAPLYTRFKLSAGRLELMTGIRERRFWSPNTRSSDVAAQAGEKALADFPREKIGCLVHASVCRDFLEPATASVALWSSWECDTVTTLALCLPRRKPISSW